MNDHDARAQLSFPILDRSPGRIVDVKTGEFPESFASDPGMEGQVRRVDGTVQGNDIYLPVTLGTSTDAAYPIGAVVSSREIPSFRCSSGVRRAVLVMSSSRAATSVAPSGAVAALMGR